MNKKLLFSIIAITFAGGLFSVAYAGPILTTITLAGNVIVTGDTEFDGKLLDTTNDAGSAGQVLSSTASGIDWIDNVGSDTLAGLSCTTDQVARWTGSVWECSTISAKTIPTSVYSVDPVGITGRESSIAIGDDGFPVISYSNGHGYLSIAKCVNIACTGESTITVVDTSGVITDGTSITIGDDGFLVVSYYDDTNDDLKVFKDGGAEIIFN